jgi:hypothetical protein
LLPLFETGPKTEASVFVFAATLAKRLKFVKALLAGLKTPFRFAGRQHKKNHCRRRFGSSGFEEKWSLSKWV